MDLIQLNWLLRKAVSVLCGVELKLTEELFEFTVCSHIKWFKVRETFSPRGEPKRHQRRDLRGGGAVGRCTVTAAGLSLVLDWADPLAGSENMLFTVSPDGRMLTVVSRVVLQSGRSVTYRTVYSRTGALPQGQT